MLLDDFYDALNFTVNGYEVVRLNERIVYPLETGFRDVLLNLKMPNGHIVELQISLKEMIEASDGDGHLYYEKYRSLQGNINTSQGGVPTIQQTKELNILMKDMQSLYNGAFEQVLAR